MVSSYMMDNPGEWAVSQEFLSPAGASDGGRACIRCSPQKYCLRLDFQLFSLWKEGLSRLQLSHTQQVTVSPGTTNMANLFSFIKGAINELIF